MRLLRTNRTHATHHVKQTTTMKTIHLLPALALCATMSSCVIKIYSNSSDADVRSHHASTTKSPSKHSVAVSEVVPLARLHTLSASTAVEVQFEQKDTIPTAYISGHLAPHCKLWHEESKAGDFRIGIKNTNQNKTSKASIKVRIVAPTLYAVQTSTGATFKATSLTTDRFDSHCSTGGSLYIETLHTTGAASLHAATGGNSRIGHLRATANVAAEASTGATITIKQLRGQNLTTQASTAGDITIAKLTTHHVTATASTSERVRLNGTAQTLTASESTAGSISQKHLRVGQ